MNGTTSCKVSVNARETRRLARRLGTPLGALLWGSLALVPGCGNSGGADDPGAGGGNDGGTAGVGGKGGSGGSGGSSPAGSGGGAGTSAAGTAASAGDSAQAGKGGGASASCTFEQSASVSPKIGTVGIVTFATTLAGIQSAKIDFGLTTSYGMT